MELSALCAQHNFSLKNIRPIPGLEAELVEMVYDKTGTELCWVKSEESNKLFCIGFKTLPEDSTGVFHILEHSVLCGSAKYPVKEPFVSLLKSSMNTFLNAMTFPDKTIYPVSSRNEQDFMNLTEVYLDAVFAPSILTNPNIYRQEGWHYEEKEGELCYNGVVFNEMKGAMSSVDSIAYRTLQGMLFPDNGYHWNSGGDPAVIPDLSYEQFVDTYRKNYHPSNARIFLDGKVPVERVLTLLDEYLSKYEMGSRQQIQAQNSVSEERSVYYEATNDGSPKAELALGKIMSGFEDKQKIMALTVLCDVLAGSNDAPLKRAVLESRLCQDMELEIQDGIMQPFMMLTLKNMEDENAAKLEELIHSTAAELADRGISREMLTASINRFAFKTQQMDEPQGLIRCINSLNSWLYEGDPMMYLHFEDAVAGLREMAENGGFEPLLREMLVDTDGLCRLHVLPAENYGEEQRKTENERLAREKAAFSAEKLEEIRAQAQELANWQQTPDSPEDEARLPKLSLSEISPEPAFTGTEVETVNGVTVLRHKVSSNGIIHLSAYFDLTDRSLAQLTELSILGKLLGNLPTKTRDAAKLQNDIKTYLGKLSFSVGQRYAKGCTDKCTPMLTVRCSVLKENLDKAEEIILDILTGTDFRQSERVREIILQTETEKQQAGMMGGHALAMSCALAQFSAAGAVSEATGAISSIRWLHDMAKEFDARFDGFCDLMEETLAKAVCAKRMTLSLTEDGHSDPAGFIARFPEGTRVPESAEYKTELPRALGIRIPAQVSFATIGYHLGLLGEKFRGSGRIVSNILSLDQLWNEIRVQGGAYGAGMRVGRGGGVFTYSYRDPNPARSLGVYRSMAGFMEKLAASGQDISGYIISSIAETEPLVGAAEQGNIADDNYFSGFGYEDAAAERRSMLEATTESLGAWCRALEAMAKDGSICVVGYAGALDGCKDEELTIMDI